MLGDIKPDQIKGTLERSQGNSTHLRVRSLTRNPDNPQSVAGRACKCRMRRDQPEPGYGDSGPQKVWASDSAAPHPGMSLAMPLCPVVCVVCQPVNCPAPKGQGRNEGGVVLKGVGSVTGRVSPSRINSIGLRQRDRSQLNSKRADCTSFSTEERIM